MKNHIQYPSGLPFIIGNEAAERFSYYGMKGILVVFMTRHLLTAGGAPDRMSEDEATFWFHLFAAANYLFPLFGAIIADVYLGKYRTIILLSLVYCLGHLALAIDSTRMGLALGLALIAAGSGGIKPCVSAHLGDQFRPEQALLLPRAFAWFYLSVNIGATVAAVLTPWLLEEFGPHVAFGTPGALMLIATVIFRLGRSRYRALPAAGPRLFIAAFSKAQTLQTLRSLILVYLCVAVFWALFDQTGSSWVIQAEQMDSVVQFMGVSFELLPAQLQAINPILLIIMIPLSAKLLLPLLEQRLGLTRKGKLVVGLLLSCAAFLIVTEAALRLDAGDRISIVWQLWAYLVITLAELLLSITALELSYAAFPSELKSFGAVYYLLAVSVGNLFTAALTLILSTGGYAFRSGGPGYLLVFAVAALVAALVCYRFGQVTEQSELADFGNGPSEPAQG